MDERLRLFAKVKFFYRYDKEVQKYYLTGCSHNVDRLPSHKIVLTVSGLIYTALMCKS